VTSDGPEVARVVDGSRCRVVAGTHQGKVGTVADRKLSKTGQVTITVRQDDGVCFKTLARNVSPA
jgi:ribosomal protein S4E